MGFKRLTRRRRIELFFAEPWRCGERHGSGFFRRIFPLLYWKPLEERSKLEALLSAAADRAPKLLSERYVPTFTLLMETGWIRPLDEWTPRGRSDDSIMRSLVEHVAVRYPIPRFLFSVYVGDEPSGADACARRVFRDAARGWSVRRAFKSLDGGPVMTKAMCRLFLGARPESGFYEAVRRAQVASCGGGPALENAVARTFLARERRAAERLWLAAIEWLSTLEAVEFDRLGEVFDYLSRRFEERPDFSFSRRTWMGLVRGMEEWHRDLARLKSVGSDVFPRSGYRNGAWKGRRRSAKGECKDCLWTVHEVLSGEELFEEGASMRHCVSIYAPYISRGESSVWSLRREGERALTIEVDNKRRRIVQAKGKCNRAPQSWELDVVETWARENAMKMDL